MRLSMNLYLFVLKFFYKIFGTPMVRPTASQVSESGFAHLSFFLKGQHRDKTCTHIFNDVFEVPTSHWALVGITLQVLSS